MKTRTTLSTLTAAGLALFAGIAAAQQLVGLIPVVGQVADMSVGGQFAADVDVQGFGDADMTTWGMPQGATMEGSAASLTDSQTYAAGSVIVTTPVCPGGICSTDAPVQNQVQMAISGSQTNRAAVAANVVIPAGTPLSGSQTLGVSNGSSALSAIGGGGNVSGAGVSLIPAAPAHAP